MKISRAAAEQKNALPQHINFANTDLIDGIDAAVYTCDLTGKITFFNKAAVKLWGREPEIGKDMWCGSWKIYKSDGSPLLSEECSMAVTLKEGREIKGEEIIIERPDGKRINVLPHPKPVYDTAGRINGAVNILIDISREKEIEEALQESETKYRLLSLTLEEKVKERTATLIKSEERYHKMVEEVRDYAILLLDKDGYILNWNKGAENIKGYSEREILGKNFRIFYQEEDRISMLPESLIEQAAVNGKAMHEGWRVRKDGTRFWGSIVITALHDDEGDILGFSKVTRDLTDKKLADDRMQQYARDIESQNRQLEEYAYVASHDLQEPLRKIQSFSELLEKNIDDETASKRFLEKIKTSAARMSVLIKDVLSYSQVSQTEHLFEVVDLNKIAENVKDDFELLLTEKSASIIYSSLPSIKGIPIQMHQLFSNLINNSIKFSGDHPVIEISSQKISKKDMAKYPELNKDRNYLKLNFRDNGLGFEQQYADQVFKLFKRLDSEKSGTGIGLALCKKIVENHSGYISVISEPGKGTTFNIILPV